MRWRGILSRAGAEYYFFTDYFLSHAANIVVNDYVVYSPHEGRWVSANVYEAKYHGPGEFLIYRTYGTPDDECPGIANLVRKLHQRMTRSGNIPKQLPNRYCDLVIDLTCEDEIDSDDNDV